MAEARLRRRGHGEDAIYFAAAKNRYVGAVSLGYAPGWEADPAEGLRQDQAGSPERLAGSGTSDPSQCGRRRGCDRSEAPRSRHVELAVGIRLSEVASH